MANGGCGARRLARRERRDSPRCRTPPPKGGIPIVDQKCGSIETASAVAHYHVFAVAGRGARDNTRNKAMPFQPALRVQGLRAAGSGVHILRRTASVAMSHRRMDPLTRLPCFSDLSRQKQGESRCSSLAARTDARAWVRVDWRKTSAKDLSRGGQEQPCDVRGQSQPMR